VLILDEQTTHLDIQARESLEEALEDYQGTIILVSHDIDFTRHVSNQIIAMTPPGITRYAGGYDYYHQKMEEAEQRQEGSRRGAEDAEREKKAKPSSSPTNTQPAPSTTDKKELRRQRAEARQALYNQTKDFKCVFRAKSAG
jgi:ATP-binding cassette, subfamily F, member 3